MKFPELYNIGVKLGIYRIVNLVNGKKYVGRSVNFRNRFHGHKSALNRNKHCNPHLQNSWNKYGSDSFSFEIVNYGYETETLELYEQFFLDTYVKWGFDYNVNRHAEHTTRIQITEEHRKNISKAKLKNKRVVSDKTKQLLREINLGKKMSKESVEKTRKANSKKVGAFTKNGELIHTFESMTKAARYFKCAPNSISECCAGKFKTCKGYYWKKLN